MDYDKLIERLKAKDFERDYDCTPFECGAFGLLDEATTAIEALQAENERLQEEAKHWKNVHHQAALNFQQENRECNKALAGLARVTAEKDAAIESIPHDCKTCVYHTVFFNGCTPDHDCTNPDGGCSNNYDRWK